MIDWSEAQDAYESERDQQLEEEHRPQLDKEQAMRPTKMSIEYPDGSGETWLPDGGWKKNEPTQAEKFHDFIDKEAIRYANLLAALNDSQRGVKTLDGKPFVLEHSGGGMTHAGWYMADPDDPSGPALASVLIDDNQEGIMTGAYVGEEQVMPYLDTYVLARTVEGLSGMNLHEVVLRAQIAMRKVDEYLNCTHPEPHKVLTDDWSEDQEVMARVVQCPKCERTGTFMGTLEFTDDENWYW